MAVDGPSVPAAAVAELDIDEADLGLLKDITWVVWTFRWQCLLLYVLVGKVSCWVFWVAMCVVVYFKWQSEFLGLLRGNVCCCMS